MDPKAEDIDRERFTLLWKKAEPSLQAFIFAAIRSPQDAEDVAQQVAMAAARRFDEFDAGRPFVAWVLWLAKSKLIDYYRKQGRQHIVFSHTLLDQMSEALVERQPQLDARQEALAKCIQKLPARSQWLLRLRYESDMPMEELANEAQMTAASMRVTLFRIRDLLSACVKMELSKQTP